MDEARFEALWHAHYADILAFSLRRLGDRQEAADATADTFLIAWRRSAEIPDNVRPWLYGVALKVVANRHRGERRRGALAARLGGCPTRRSYPRPTSCRATSWPPSECCRRAIRRS